MRQGLAAEYLANLGHNVTAFDASQNMIELVPKHAKLGVIRRHLILSQKMKYLMVSGPVFHFFMQKGKIYHVYLPVLEELLNRVDFFYRIEIGTGEKRDTLGRRYTYVSQAELCQLLKSSGFDVFDHIIGKDIGLDGVNSDGYLHMPKHKLVAYTDGACSGNPGQGDGVSFFKLFQMVKLSRNELSNGEKRTTNNKMELRAAIAALEILDRTMKLQSLQIANML